MPSLTFCWFSSGLLDELAIGGKLVALVIARASMSTAAETNGNIGGTIRTYENAHAVLTGNTVDNTQDHGKRFSGSFFGVDAMGYSETDNSVDPGAQISASSSVKVNLGKSVRSLILVLSGKGGVDISIAVNDTAELRKQGSFKLVDSASGRCRNSKRNNHDCD